MTIKFNNLFILVFCLIGYTGSTQNQDYKWMNQEPHQSGLWLTAKGKKIYDSTPSSILALKRISTADSSFVRGGGDALGYGVSCLIDDTLVTAHYARACHWGCAEKYLEGTSRCVVRYSTDKGDSWSTPLRLDDEIACQNGETAANGWGLAMGKVKDTVYLASSRGFFKSYDKGRSWECITKSFVLGTRGFKGNGKVHIGPQIIPTENAGLLIFGQDDTIEDGKFIVLNSTDGGNTWQRTLVDTGNDKITPFEPTAVKFDKNLIFFLTRNSRNGQGSNPSQFTMKVNGPGDYEIINPKISNCTVTGHQDTHDVIYNPITDQFEAIVSDRCKNHSDYNIMSLCLWAIKRKAVLDGSAEWRKIGYFFPPMVNGSDAEGSHPGGSSVDLKNKLQYIQVHRGVGHAVSSSIYHLQRTLETDKLEPILVK